MVEVINKYETIFIVDVTKTEEEVNSIVEKMKSLIESNATVEAVDIWGKRRLAYEIDDKTEGFYVLVSFSSKPDSSDWLPVTLLPVSLEQSVQEGKRK